MSKFTLMENIINRKTFNESKDIKNLNQLKKALVKGAKYKIVGGKYAPDKDEQEKEVVEQHSNFIINNCGSRLYFDNPEEWKFEDGLAKNGYYMDDDKWVSMIEIEVE